MKHDEEEISRLRRWLVLMLNAGRSLWKAKRLLTTLEMQTSSRPERIVRDMVKVAAAQIGRPSDEQKVESFRRRLYRLLAGSCMMPEDIHVAVRTLFTEEQLITDRPQTEIWELIEKAAAPIMADAEKEVTTVGPDEE